MNQSHANNIKEKNSGKTALLKRALPAGPLLLFADLLSFLTVAVLMFIPVYTRIVDSGQRLTRSFIDPMIGKSSDTGLFVGFFICLAAIIGALILLVSALRRIGKDNVRFARISGHFLYFNFSLTAAFFIVGSALAFYYRKNGMDVDTNCHIPFIISSVLTVSGGYFRHILYQSDEKKTRKIPGNRIIAAAFVTLFSLISGASVFFDIVVVKLTISGSTRNFRINGIDLLRHYKNYGAGFQMLTFIEFAALICISVTFVIAITSFFSGSDEFKSVGKLSIGVDFLIIFALSMFGKYYEIAEKLNEEHIFGFLDAIGYSYYRNILNLDIKITSPLIYMLIFATAAAVALLIFKPFTKIKNEDAANISSAVYKNDAAETEETTPAPPSISKGDLDPCPAFTAIDRSILLLKGEQAVRNSKDIGSMTLPQLVDFVVSYARESRLHLSYSHESIAAFIAGLGSSKLSILQGMSGTGKTSLPKIFCEAVMGSCEIIEVESSWKDKNELLGYYNEFSGLYTPKKFTRALYKAALVPDTLTFIVLDEMNLSRIEYYFSDFLSLMENEEDKRAVRLSDVPLVRTVSGASKPYTALNGGSTLKIPPSVWFIGTANRDESTFEISDKVYDRAFTMNFTKRAPKARPYLSPMDARYLSYARLCELFENAKDSVSFDVENSETVKEVEKLLSAYNISFGNRVAAQIEDFVRIYSSCFPGSSDAAAEGLETILLTKLVNKLEFKNIINREELIGGFEKLGLYRCSEFVKGLGDDSFYA